LNARETGLQTRAFIWLYLNQIANDCYRIAHNSNYHLFGGQSVIITWHLFFKSCSHYCFAPDR